MKKLFTLSAIALSTIFFAQEAGKAGELLKNEASRTEMQTKKSDIASRSNNNNNNNNNNQGIENSGYRNQNRNNSSADRGRITKPNYRWSQNYGYSEVFIRIPENGYFSVEVGDQIMSNNSGKFRFFDLNSGRIPVSIYEDGYLIYRTTVSVANNSRMILDFFTDHGLYLLDTVPVRNQYGFNNWDDVWNNPYGNYGGNQNYYGNVMNAGQFSNFIESLKRNATFDDSKVEMITMQFNRTMFTSQQIKEMLETMSFDKNKLIVAKKVYTKCVDRNNFFMVHDAFSFDSYRKDLMRYISSLG